MPLDRRCLPRNCSPFRLCDDPAITGRGRPNLSYKGACHVTPVGEACVSTCFCKFLARMSTGTGAAVMADLRGHTSGALEF